MTTRGRVARAAITGALVVASALGLVVVGAAIAPAVGWRVVHLETGSMAPQFPEDSLLLVRSVDPDDVAVGDVVTVTRAGSAPVTHRVVAVSAAGAGVRLELQGDANLTPDPQPYLVDRVGLVVAGIPTGGQVVEVARSLPGVVALSAIAAALILWAWWPRRAVPAHRADAQAVTS